MVRRTIWAIRLVGATAIVGAAAGIDAMAQNDAGPPADVLRGPAVDMQANSPAPTLVRRDASGKMIPLEQGIEEAALALLELDMATRAKIETLIVERAAKVDRAVIENVALLTQIKSAMQEGPQAARPFIEELLAKAPVLGERAAWAAEISAALPEAQRTEFERLMSEYREARLEDLRVEAGETGAGMMALIGRERAMALGQEIKASYDRTTQFRQSQFDELIETLELTPEQEAEVRRIALDFAQKTQLNPNEADRSEVIRQIIPLLTPEQRAKLREEMGGRRGDRGIRGRHS